MMIGFRWRVMVCGALLLAGCAKRVAEDQGATDDGTTGPGFGDDGSPGDGEDGDETGGGDSDETGGGGTDEPGTSGTDEPGTSGTDEPGTSSTGEPGTSDTGGGEPPEGITVWYVAGMDCGGGNVSAFEGLPHFQMEWDQAVCEEPVDCTGNTAPELGEPVYLANGLLVDKDSIEVGDAVGVLVPFVDAECNISCGSQGDYEQCPSGDDSGGGASLGINVPCDTESSGVWIGIDLHQLATPGQYTASVHLDDHCGEMSNRIELTISV